MNTRAVGTIGDLSAGATRIRYCRGAVDPVSLDSSEVHISGWVLHPQIPLDRVTLAIDGTILGETGIEPRPDVAEAFGTIPHAGTSGFRLTANPPTPLHRMSELTVTGQTSAGVVRFRSLLPEPFPQGPSPPPELMQRVSGTADRVVFHAIGRQVAADLCRAIDDGSGGARPMSILDWGCGPGRVTPYLASLLPGSAIVGSDVDAAAIAWCTAQFKDLRFATQATLPPLPFAPSSFDVVVGSSVFTHLDAFHQAAWIRELHRILKPDGRLIASTHGRFSASFFPELTRDLDQRGIIDSIRDGALDALCPTTYYRSVFQTRAYTEQLLHPHFHMDGYTEAGLASFQDLFIATRLSTSP